MSHEHKYHIYGRIIATVNWSIEYDNQSIIVLCLLKPKMSYADIKTIIECEGGYVDDEGIIHKGSATTKIAEI